MFDLKLIEFNHFNEKIPQDGDTLFYSKIEMMIGTGRVRKENPDQYPYNLYVVSIEWLDKNIGYYGTSIDLQYALILEKYDTKVILEFIENILNECNKEIELVARSKLYYCLQGFEYEWYEYAVCAEMKVS